MRDVFGRPGKSDQAQHGENQPVTTGYVLFPLYHEVMAITKVEMANRQVVIPEAG